MTLEEYVMEWLLTKEDVIKDSSLALYSTWLNRYILPEFGKTELINISKKEVLRFAKKIRIRGGAGGKALSERTVRSILTLMREILKDAAEEELMPYVNTKGIKIPKSVREDKKRTLRADESELLCQYLIAHPSKMNLGILVAALCGLRVGEVCGLMWRDIDLDNKVLKVRRTVSRIKSMEKNGSRTVVRVGAPKSETSRRDIPLSGALWAILTAFRDADDYFIVSGKTSPTEPRSVQKAFKARLRRLNMEDINFHALRHTFATRLIDSGLNIKTVSTLLGHSKTSITLDIYDHSDEEQMRGAMEAATQILGGGSLKETDCF